MLGVFLSACTSFTPSIRTDDSVDVGSAYLYGNLFIDAPEKLFGHASIGLVLRCQDGREYTLGLSKRAPLQVFRISPSICSVTQMVLTAPNHEYDTRLRVPKSALRDARFEPGVAYYLGDIAAEASVDYRPFFLHNEYLLTWQIKSVRNNYEATTAYMKSAFPNVAPLQTQVRLLLGEMP
jgi:hypothetical protein